MSSPTRVQRHFDDDSARFDAIYQGDKSAFESFIDTRIRGVVVDRLRRTRVLAPLPGSWSVLDVGCGSGRYGLALVADGATRAVGWRVTVGKARFALARSDVRFFDRAEVEAIAGQAGIGPERSFVLDFGRDWILLARLGGNRSRRCVESRNAAPPRGGGVRETPNAESGQRARSAATPAGEPLAWAARTCSIVSCRSWSSVTSGS